MDSAVIKAGGKKRPVCWEIYFLLWNNVYKNAYTLCQLGMLMTIARPREKFNAVFSFG
jgi:hypothetical protein